MIQSGKRLRVGLENGKGSSRKVSSEQTVQIVCGALAVLCVVVIVMRRKSGKKKADAGDDF